MVWPPPKLRFAGFNLKGEEYRMSEDRIVEALQALAERDGDREASPEVEARLRQAFQRRLAVRRLRRSLWTRAGLWATAAAAVVAGIVIFSGGRHRPEPAPAVARTLPSVQQAPPPAEAAPVITKP